MVSDLSKVQTDRQCPQCGRSTAVRAPRQGFPAQVLSWVNYYPYRCKHHTCKHRFQSFGKN